MSGIMRNPLRAASTAASTLRCVLTSSSLPSSSPNNRLARTLWNMYCQKECAALSFADPTKFREYNHPGKWTCTRYYSRHTSHTKAEKELVEFLAEEIVAEKKAQKLKTIPMTIDDFTVSLNGAEVSLDKKDGNDTVHIHFNVNHTVDTDSQEEVDPRQDEVEVGEMMSKPVFSVNIARGNQTLGFTCSYNNQPGSSGADESYNDIFGIDEIMLYEGEHSDKVYTVAGEIIDGYLYDLLMNYLEEKGVSNEFAKKLVNLSTNYEHTAYVSLLEGLSKFTSGK